MYAPAPVASTPNDSFRLQQLHNYLRRLGNSCVIGANCRRSAFASALCMKKMQNSLNGTIIDHLKQGKAVYGKKICRS